MKLKPDTSQRTGSISTTLTLTCTGHIGLRKTQQQRRHGREAAHPDQRTAWQKLRSMFNPPVVSLSNGVKLFRQAEPLLRGRKPEGMDEAYPELQLYFQRLVLKKPNQSKKSRVTR
jgi:hypothetical protein